MHRLPWSNGSAQRYQVGPTRLKRSARSSAFPSFRDPSVAFIGIGHGEVAFSYKACPVLTPWVKAALRRFSIDLVVIHVPYKKLAITAAIPCLPSNPVSDAFSFFHLLGQASESAEVLTEDAQRQSPSPSYLRSALSTNVSISDLSTSTIGLG